MGYFYKNLPGYFKNHVRMTRQRTVTVHCNPGRRGNRGSKATKYLCTWLKSAQSGLNTNLDREGRGVSDVKVNKVSDVIVAGLVTS